MTFDLYFILVSFGLAIGTGAPLYLYFIFYVNYGYGRIRFRRKGEKQMTREEMIIFGEMFLEANPASKNTDRYEFVEKLLELLKQEPCNVAIDKKQVFDILRRHHREAIRDVDGDIVPGDYTEDIYDEIKALPPVTPKTNYEDIAKAFQIGLLFGFGEKHDEMDKIINEVKKVATPSVSDNIDTMIPYLMHKEMDIPISECKKAYDVAIGYLRSQVKVKG